MACRNHTVLLAVLTVSATTAAVAALRASGLRRRHVKCISKWQLQMVSSLFRSYWICHVRIPIATLTDLQLHKDADAEGLVECHVMVKDGHIAALVNAHEKTNFGYTPRINAHSSIWMPYFVDAHTHLIKTQTVPRLRNTTGTMIEAYTVEEQDQAMHWSSVAKVERCMDFGLQCAMHYGTRAIRTHLDGCSAEDPKVVEAVYMAYENMVLKYNKLGVILQGVANLYLPLWLQEPFATHHADRAAQHTNVVLGAYVGNPSASGQTELDTVQAMQALLRHAQRLNHIDIDFHIDESNDPSCCALLSLIIALRQARQQGYQGRVVLGHACALSLQQPDRQAQICNALTELQVCIVANPTTNLGLQDRRGTGLPYGFPIDRDLPRTPQWRGLTLIQELEAAGVLTAVATDNVRDHWHPYGDFNLLYVWGLALQLAHLDTVPSPGAWAHLCTTAPAIAIGLDTIGALAVKASADGILYSQVRRFSELLARSPTKRIMLRQGRVQKIVPLPDFSILDDLVAMPTTRPESFPDLSTSIQAKSKYI